MDDGSHAKDCPCEICVKYRKIRAMEERLRYELDTFGEALVRVTPQGFTFEDPATKLIKTVIP